MAAGGGELGALLFHAIDRWVVPVAGAWAARCPSIPACPPTPPCPSAPPCPPCAGPLGWSLGAVIFAAVVSSLLGALAVSVLSAYVTPRVHGPALGLGAIQRRGRKAALAPEESGGTLGVVGY